MYYYNILNRTEKEKIKALIFLYNMLTFYIRMSVYLLHSYTQNSEIMS